MLAWSDPAGILLRHDFVKMREARPDPFFRAETGENVGLQDLTPKVQNTNASLRSQRIQSTRQT